MKIGIIGVGHPFGSQYNALKDLGFEIKICDINSSKLEGCKREGFNEEKFTDYKKLVGNVDAVLISTPPKTHYEIIKFFLEKDINVISEKPLVTNKSDLEELFSKDLKNSNSKFYNILHFAFGEEVLWFKENLSKLDKYKNPKKIVAYINDPYIKDGRVRDESVSLHGSYLDEAINPLSAIVKIYSDNKNILLETKDCIKEYLKDDAYDYLSTANFVVNQIDVTINVKWNDDGNKDKYIDLIFDDKRIRLDSINRKVIDMTNNKVLFESNKDRMYMHYYNGFKNYLDIETNTFLSQTINSAILKGEEICKRKIVTKNK